MPSSTSTLGYVLPNYVKLSANYLLLTIDNPLPVGLNGMKETP